MSNEESEAAAARREIDELESSADVLTAADSHGESTSPPRILRGRVIVRELEDEGTLWTPPTNPRQVHTHRGRVLAMGPPAKTRRIYDRERGWIGGVEVPHGFKVGDVVQFHFEHHQECWTFVWHDGKPCTVLAQHNIDAVIE